DQPRVARLVNVRLDGRRAREPEGAGMSGRHGRALAAIPFLVLGALVARPAALAGADPIALTGGQSARFRAYVKPSRNNAVITISRDDAVQPALDPIACPANPQVRIRASDGFDTGPIVLPCALWKRSGKGFRYADKLAAASGVYNIAYAPRRLV